MRIGNPLPQRHLTDGEGIGGLIKARPEDFVVEELPLYEPSGSGEHLYLRVEKIGVSHVELISCLRRHFKVVESAIGFAGMKDKHAVTRQTVSISLPGPDPPDLDPSHDRIRVQWASRHTNKIRLGHLASNRFSARIREVDPVRVTRVKRMLDALQASGLPDYFGAQRFGYRRNNHLLGALLTKRDYRGLLAELLGATGSPFPEHQRERRELFDQGRHEEAAVLWTIADRNELVAINALRSGREERAAAHSVGRSPLAFWVSALQSAIFNRVLDGRIDAGTLTRLVEGDLAWKHDSGAVFSVTAAELERPELARRLAGLEVSPSGPLWGPGMTRPGPGVLAAEQRALEAAGVDLEGFVLQGRHVQGARRPLRVPLANVETSSGVDEHGSFVRVAFDLPPGAYATVLLEELMKSELSAVAARGRTP